MRRGRQEAEAGAEASAAKPDLPTLAAARNLGTLTKHGETVQAITVLPTNSRFLIQPSPNC